MLKAKLNPGGIFVTQVAANPPPPTAHVHRALVTAATAAAAAAATAAADTFSTTTTTYHTSRGPPPCLSTHPLATMSRAVGRRRDQDDAGRLHAGALDSTARLPCSARL